MKIFIKKEVNITAEQVEQLRKWALEEKLSMDEVLANLINQGFEEYERCMHGVPLQNICGTCEI